MAEFDDLKKSIDELRKIEAERLKMEKKEFEETTKDRSERVSKQAFEGLVKELRTNNNLEKIADDITQKKLDELVKGPIAKLVKSSSTNSELQAAQLSLTNAAFQDAADRSSDREKADRVASSIFGRSIAALQNATDRSSDREKADKGTSSIFDRSIRIFATLTSRFLETTQTGQLILGRAIDETSATGKIVSSILDRELKTEGAFKGELEKLREQLSGKFDSVKKGLGKIRDGAKETLQFFTDPTKFIKTIASWFWKLVARPLFFLLFKGIGFLLKLPFKAIDKLASLFRGKAGGTFALKRTEEKREKDREGKQRSSLIEKLTGLRMGIGSLAKALRLGTAAGGLGALVTAIGGILLIAVPFMISAVKEFIKTGDFQKTIGEGFVGIARVLTLGLFDPEKLRELIKAPFLDMISGIKSLIAGEFTAEAFLKALGGTGKFAAAPFEIAFDLGTKIISGVARLLGFENFADELKAVFADFNLFDSIVGGINSVIDSMVSFFTGATKVVAVGIANLDTNVTAAKIAKITDKANLDAILEALLISQSEQDKQVRQLRRLGKTKEADKAQEAFEKIKANIATTLKRQLELSGEMLENEETVLEQVERGKQAKAELADALTKEADQEEKSTKTFLQRAIESAQKAQAAGSALFAASAQGLSNAISNPDIASGKNLQALFSTNTDLRDKARSAINITPITSNTISAPAAPTPIIVPMALRNPENTLQQNRLRDHGAAVS